MITALIVLLITVSWSSVAVVCGAYTYSSNFRWWDRIRTARTRRINFLTPNTDYSDDPDDATTIDVDKDSLLVLPPSSIVWSNSQEVLEPTTAPFGLFPFPFVPTLDSTGLLPRSAYYYLNDNENVKPTCRLQIAWDFAPSSSSVMDVDSYDRSAMVAAMQHALDHGFTTMQMKPCPDVPQRRLQEEIYYSFLKDTPKSVIDQQCQIVVPIQMRDFFTTKVGDATITPLSVRTAVTNVLDRLQTDCLDNVQLQFDEKGFSVSSFDDRSYLDLLGELQELQRAGYIRSISTKDMSGDFYTNSIQKTGLHTLISSNLMTSNLCRMQRLLQQRQRYSYGQNVKTTSAPEHFPYFVAGNPLAGGWLSDRYSQFYSQKIRSSIISPPQWFSTLSVPEKGNWDANIVHGDWRKRHDGGALLRDFWSTWELYRSQCIAPLEGIARKHDVSSASVALRWLLQSKQKNVNDDRNALLLASTVVSCRLLPEHYCWDKGRPYTHPSKRVQQLREVIKFELDEEDMECLWNLSGAQEPPHLSDDWLSSEQKHVDVSSSGLFLPKR